MYDPKKVGEPVRIYLPKARKHKMAVYHRGPNGSGGYKWNLKYQFKAGDTVTFTGATLKNVTDCVGWKYDHPPKKEYRDCPQWILGAEDVGSVLGWIPKDITHSAVVLPSGDVKNCSFLHDMDEKICKLKTDEKSIGRTVSDAVLLSVDKDALELEIERPKHHRAPVFTLPLERGDTIAITNNPPESKKKLVSKHGKYLAPFFKGQKKFWKTFEAFECVKPMEAHPKCFTEILAKTDPMLDKRGRNYGPRALGNRPICPFVDYP